MSRNPSKVKAQSNLWVRYLMQMNGLSAAKASVIARAYPNFQSLFRAYARVKDESERKLLLQVRCVCLFVSLRRTCGALRLVL